MEYKYLRYDFGAWQATERFLARESNLTILPITGNQHPIYKTRAGLMDIGRINGCLKILGKRYAIPRREASKRIKCFFLGLSIMMLNGII